MIKKQTKVRAAVWLAAIFIALGIILARFYTAHAKEPVTYGVSFSVKYAQELGLDWRANYQALLGDLGVKRLRLMSYWDLTQASPGRFDFADLDWQMDQAHKAGAKISLAVGLRQPRYPECHYPEWVKKLDYPQQLDAIYAYLAATVSRYKDHPALISWQLENEGLNHGFGECVDLNRHRIIEEARILKQIDPAHPLIMNASDQVGLPVRSPRGDSVGFSVYKRYYEGKLFKRYMTYPWPPVFHSMRAALVEWYSGRRVIIHELQAEPWGPRGTVHLSVPEQDKSMPVEQLNYMLQYARATGIRDMDLWGSEWWYWRKLHGDSRFWEAVKQAI